ncbi:sensor domain-containing diguanylate cyclase [Algisphaera agarilytica]|uniref:Diguanylate cyclase (GGDEF)-like protein n=1 Tax=Algisphaera agarilytica TaxID=1385975 RepID=A0A7X0LKT5_9BACT|nr:GAF domain-containing protein [Algisphaera agarilytica]MBB6430770.1 diguanylate cyclase (GGDEF)-like protein [Algisphaera agarilytica]
MIQPPLPADEAHRLQTLRSLNLLDTPVEGRFERITQLAQTLLDMPIAAISLVESDRQWFKSIQGLSATETSREVAFCAHTIVDRQPQIIHDARENERYHDNPLVTGEPGIVFYAGQPLYAQDGSCVGSLCVIDRQPRNLDDRQVDILKRLGELTEREINHPPEDLSMSAFVDRMEQRLLATFTDPLTRLWNHIGISALLQDILTRSQDDPKTIGMLGITIPGLASMAEERGQDTVDQVVREVGRRINATAWPADVVAHVGDGRFVMAVRSGEPDHQVVRFADQLKAHIDHLPVTLEEQPIPVSIETQTRIFLPTQLTTAPILLSVVDPAPPQSGMTCVA